MPPFSHDPNWSMEGNKTVTFPPNNAVQITAPVGAVVTRGMTQRDKKAMKPLVTYLCNLSTTTPEEFHLSQLNDPSLQKQREWAEQGNQRLTKWGSSGFIFKRGQLHRETCDSYGNQSTQLVVPQKIGTRS